MTFANITLLATALTTALIAGLFYSWSVSVIPGLGKLSDANYLAAMQSINREILNPAFFMSFMGTILLLPLSTWLQYKQGTPVPFYLLLGATLLYGIGTFGVTSFGNVPLNNLLDTFHIQSVSAEELSRQRTSFEEPWNRLHSIRTIANIIALVLMLIALMVNNNPTISTQKPG
jgi:uncharacterized membrane protein